MLGVKGMIKELGSVIVIWLVAFSFLLLIVLMPTEVKFVEGNAFLKFEGVTYQYSLEAHIANIREFFSLLVAHPGFGGVEGGPSSMEILQRFGRSLALIVPAVVVALIAGMAKGILDFLHKERKGGMASRWVTFGFLSIPDIVIIVFVQIGLLTAISKGWIPHIELYGHDSMAQTILNILFLSVYPTVFIANATFRALRDQEHMDYVRTARSKGTHPFKVLYVHMLKNGIIPILAQADMMILYILSNLLIIEVFTNYRGAALYLYEALGDPTKFSFGTLITGNTFAIAGYLFYFTLLVLAMKIISGLAKYKLDVRGREGTL